MTVYNVLYMLLVFSFGLSAVAMWVNWGLNRHELAVRDWAVSLTLILIGCAVSVYARMHIPSAEAMIPVNSYTLLRDLGTGINGLAWLVIWSGTRRFVGRPVPSKKLLLVVWLAFLLVLLAAHPLGIPGAWGVAWISVVVAMCSLMVLREIFRPGMSGVATWFACAGFSLAAVTWGVRATMSFINLDRPIDAAFDTGVLFGAVISAYACMMGMILLTNQRLIDQLGSYSSRDSLTNALNRRSFFDAAEPLLAQADENDLECSIVILDIDRFSLINEEYGNDGGDKALSQISIASMQVLGRQDLFARFGGDEFIFFFYGKTSAQTRIAMNRIQISLKQNLIETKRGAFQVRLNIGIAESVKNICLEGFIQLASFALSQAKSRGADGAVVYEDVADQLSIENPSVEQRI